MVTSLIPRRSTASASGAIHVRRADDGVDTLVFRDALILAQALPIPFHP
ncbi:hypothetical protein X011_02290 [Mycobacterium tuberculosis variant microti OV254]|nr:hypothetical protein X011_02290 [Mycobacterium tuberculosis variant microti OV254]